MSELFKFDEDSVVLPVTAGSSGAKSVNVDTFSTSANELSSSLNSLRIPSSFNQNGSFLMPPPPAPNSIRVRRRSSLATTVISGFSPSSIEIGFQNYMDDSDNNNNTNNNNMVEKTDNTSGAIADDCISPDNNYKPVIEDFEPIKVLGQGAYGKVLLVRHKNTGRLFAQKQMKKASIVVSRHGERTIAEKKILSQITHHPNIVKLFYALHDPFKIYLILDYVPGGELFMHLSNQKFLNDKITSFYSGEMALALIHLHKLGIVYRDLKPENCLLNARGHLVLTDFGLSKQQSSDNGDEDVCNSIIGTPEYMAPEVLRGENYSYEVDWWSLGCVIFDMLSGKPPFTGNNHKIVMNKILTEKIKYPFYFTQEAKDLLNKLINKNTNKRFKVDQDFKKFQEHRFFRHIDWEKIKSQSDDLVPPIVPVITDPALAENFDPQFTEMKFSAVGVQDVEEEEEYNESKGIPITSNNNSKSKQQDGLTNVQAKLFEGFSYTASNSYLESFLNP
ncbi:hypothetical protein PACTADRAFT_48951 [Pachysolen tannophilus NRRL Y-2460]|uniref:Protein kinase domain-containing protein n=1 Tax=Pachysolen tannophilus NRRL Y-2460 TaxID=669874 RepID=A0A1E4TZN2_PACTA|nr:hypothetical protein PACTADRAFT_48951 [Pachysolen tannophilus NRRL Y-2460]